MDSPIPAITEQWHATSTVEACLHPPIHKKGDRTDPKNYHPISLTLVVCKTMEHVIVSQLTKHLSRKEQNLAQKSIWL